MIYYMNIESGVVDVLEGWIKKEEGKRKEDIERCIEEGWLVKVRLKEPNMNTRHLTYRASKEDMRMIEFLQSLFGESRSQVLRRAIQDLYRRKEKAVVKQPSSS